MKLSDFPHVVEFPKRADVLYVLFCGKEDGKPFYVGETASFIGRMNDYLPATFAAATDFKVGGAVRYLTANNIHVRVGYQEHPDRAAARAAETRWMKQLREQRSPLLGDRYPSKSAARGRKALGQSRCEIG